MLTSSLLDCFRLESAYELDTVDMEDEWVC